MSEIMKMANEEVIMTSLEVVELINNFRKEEGNKILKQHNTLMRDIRTELELLEKAGIEGQHNFVQSTYRNSQNKIQPCYQLKIIND